MKPQTLAFIAAGLLALGAFRRPYQTEERVTKGGSFLCSPSYCESYRPSARRGTPPDTGMSHIGFRCAMSAGGQETAFANTQHD